MLWRLVQPARRSGAICGVLALFPLPVATQEIVSDFRGYPWGVRPTEIAEIAESEPVGERDGLVIYSTPVRFAGRDALAGFYFHPETGALLEGAYALVLTPTDCDLIWGRVTRILADQYPSLDREDNVASRENADRPDVYDSDCDYYIYNYHVESWTADFRNPDPPFGEIHLRLRITERTPRLTILFRGAAGKEWADRPR